VWPGTVWFGVARRDVVGLGEAGILTAVLNPIRLGMVG
jgi:hypothetical protein